MMEKLFLIKTSLVPIYLIHAVIISDKFEKFSLLNGYRCHQGYTISESMKVLNVLDCARACSGFPSCSGLFHQRNTSKCTTCSSQCNISTTNDVMTGSVFYRRKVCPSDDLDWIYLPKECSRINVQLQIVTHAEATAYCESIDAYLFKVDEKWKMDFLVELLRNCEGLDDQQFWLDGTNTNAVDHYAPDAWKFHDGKVVPMDKYYWASHAPNSPETHHCFRIVDGLFDDTNCDFKFSFICEK